MTGHDFKTIDRALDELEAKCFLTRIIISPKETKYYWFENPNLNIDFMAGIKRKKIEDIKPLVKKHRTSPRSQVLDDEVKKAISTLKKAQIGLLNSSNQRRLLDEIDDMQLINEQLHAKLEDNNTDQDENKLKIV